MTIACDPFWAWALLIAASIPLAAYGLAMLALVRYGRLQQSPINLNPAKK